MSVDKKYDILITIETSWGEVDWILPVLFKSKIKNPKLRIAVVFLDDFIYNKKEETIDLFHLLSEISSIIIFPGKLNIKKKRSLISRIQTKLISISTKFLSREGVFVIRKLLYSNFLISSKNNYVHKIGKEYIDFNTVRLILRDFELRRSSYYKTVFKKCIYAKVIAYPHANYINFLHPSVEYPIKLNEKQDLILENSELNNRWDNEYWATNIKVVGFPNLDPWWLNKYINLGERQSIQSHIRKAQPYNILLISRGPFSQAGFSNKQYLDRLNQLATFLERRDDLKLLIKSHPREDTKLIKSIFKKVKDWKWELLNTSLQNVLETTDFVITFYGSGALQALALKKPVIEFQSYPIFDKVKTPVLLKEGNSITHAYLTLGLYISAKDIEKVGSLVDLYINNPNDSVFIAQRNSFDKISTSNSCEKASEVILEQIT